MKGLSISRVFVGAMLLFVVVLVSAPLLANAGPANAMCNPVIQMCGCMMKFDPQKGCIPGENKFQCPCYETVNGGTTMGKCMATNYCHGESHSGGSGESGGGLGMQQLMQALQGVMGALKGGGGGGGGGGGSGSGGAGDYGGGSGGCSSYYQTSDMNSSDPCAYFVPEVASSTSGGYNPYYNPYNPGGGSSTSTAGCSSFRETHDENDSDPCTFYTPQEIIFGDNTPSDGGTTSSSAKSNNNENDAFITRLLNTIAGIGGTEGNILVTDKGITIYAGGANRDTNTGVAGFFGSDTFGGQPQGIVARLCIDRPWTGGLVSAIIPPSFFDNLCKWRGYQVGDFRDLVGAGGLIQLESVLLKNGNTLPAQQSAAQKAPVPAVANIWAVPPAVPIGARTSIFWNSKLVKECVVTSSDGSFRETSLAGGASTVPIADATIFTITCTATDDTQISNSVLVTIKI